MKPSVCITHDQVTGKSWVCHVMSRVNHGLGTPWSRENPGFSELCISQTWGFTSKPGVSGSCYCHYGFVSITSQITANASELGGLVCTSDREEQGRGSQSSRCSRLGQGPPALQKPQNMRQTRLSETAINTNSSPLTAGAFYTIHPCGNELSHCKTLRDSCFTEGRSWTEPAETPFERWTFGRSRKSALGLDPRAVKTPCLRLKGHGVFKLKSKHEVVIGGPSSMKGTQGYTGTPRAQS